MIQKFLLNDEQGYEHYMSKTVSIKNMQLVLNDNYTNNGPDSEMGIIVSSGSEHNQGKLILCNQKIKDMTDFENNDLRNQSIEIFMPPIIKDWHRRFVDEFN